MTCVLHVVAMCVVASLPADDKPDIQTLVKQIKTAREVKVRVKALADLAKLGPDAKEASQALVEVMMERTPMIRQAASEALEKINLPLHGPVIKMLVDMEKRFAAVDELVGLEAEAKPALPLLLALYKGEVATGSGSQLRSSDGVTPASKLLHAMVKIAPEDKVVLQTLLDTITVKAAGSGTAKAAGSGGGYHPGRHVAIELAVELEKIDAKLLTKALISATTDMFVRLRAIEGLGQLGSRAKDAIPTLKKLKLDSDERVRDAAAAALEKVEKE